MSQSGRYLPGTGSAPIETLTGDSGGPVSPDGAFNIDILGGNNITTVGNPGTNSITIDLDANIADTYTTDSGNAVPAGGILQVVGGTNVNTSGAGNTITINASADLDLNYTAVNTTPYVVLATDQFLGVDCSAAPVTIELENAPAIGRVVIIKDSTGNANTNNISVTTVGGVVTIDGVTTFTMNTQYASIQVIFNGASYEIF